MGDDGKKRAEGDLCITCDFALGGVPAPEYVFWATAGCRIRWGQVWARAVFVVRCSLMQANLIWMVGMFASDYLFNAGRSLKVTFQTRTGYWSPEVNEALLLLCSTMPR